MPPSAFDDVLESVRAALNSKRGEASERIVAIEAALRGYERALELEIAEAFANEHRLKQPAQGMRAAEAALKLARAVAQLPELAARTAAKKPETDPQATPAAVEEEPLRERLAPGKLVIIGALSGREKTGQLPAELDFETEWIDTERDGVHAVGNLPQRIRQGRVAAVIILERIVSHKHSEPVVAAARDAHVPVAFAGQGGRASLARALTQIDAMRRERG